MSERPDRDPFEDEIRQALQSEYDRAERTGGPNSDDVLQRIHRRVDRRRKQRRAGVFFATAAMIAAITVVVPFVSPTTPIDEATDGPHVGSAPERTESAADGRTTEKTPSPAPHATMDKGQALSSRELSYVPPRHAGASVSAKNVLVSSVSGSSSDEFWVSASATCGRRTCNVLGHSEQSDAPTFTELPGNARHTQTTVRFSGDGQSGWMTNGAEIFRTDDGGADWSRLRHPESVQVEGLESWGDQVWVVGDRGSQSVVFTEANGSGMLQKLDPADGRAPKPDLAVALGEDAFGVPLAGGQPDFAYTTDDGVQWNLSDIGCHPADLSATKDVIWAFCNDSTPTVVRSVDQGQTWETPERLLDIPPSEDPTAIAAIGPDAAFVVSGSDGWVVDNGVATRATGLGDGPYVYAGFTTESVGYVIDVDGSMCRTDDGGQTWNPVELP